MKKELGIFILLLALAILVYSFEPNFIQPYNVKNMLNRISMFGIFSIGCGIVIITGGIDLSIGSAFALLGVVLCMLLREFHWPWPLAVAATAVGCMGLGALHGALVTGSRMKPTLVAAFAAPFFIALFLLLMPIWPWPKAAVTAVFGYAALVGIFCSGVSLQPFVVTLCGLLIYRSQARYIANEGDKGLGNVDFGFLDTLTRGQIPLGRYFIPSAFLILLVVAVVMWFVLHRSIYGRYLFAVGRNEEAARFSGINTKLVIGSAYVVSMLLVAFSGILLVFDTNSISPNSFGNFYELYGIAAAVLGGCSLRGGEGSIIGVILGTALLQLLMNLVTLLGFQSSLEGTVMGVVILVGVGVDEYLTNRRRSKLAVKQPLAVPATTAAK
jgi:ribose transport system permease protein